MGIFPCKQCFYLLDVFTKKISSKTFLLSWQKFRESNGFTKEFHELSPWFHDFFFHLTNVKTLFYVLYINYFFISWTWHQNNQSDVTINHWRICRLLRILTLKQMRTMYAIISNQVLILVSIIIAFSIVLQFCVIFWTCTLFQLSVKTQKSQITELTMST